EASKRGTPISTLADSRDRAGLHAGGRLGSSCARWRPGLPNTARDHHGRPSRSGQLGVPPGSRPVASPRSPRRLVRPRQDLGPGRRRWGRCRGQPADSGDERNLTGGTTARRSAQHGGGSAFRLRAVRTPLSHRCRVCRGTVKPDRARRDAPGMGRPGRRPLSGTDGRLRQAPWPAREGLHGAHQAVPVRARVPGNDARDRTSVAETRCSGGRVLRRIRDFALLPARSSCRSPCANDRRPSPPGM
ncbi:MAG: hypothetical protein AVDCRST_MAG59-4158, partial [uncultured Thermomicrobiales bacterium]